MKTRFWNGIAPSFAVPCAIVITLTAPVLAMSVEADQVVAGWATEVWSSAVRGDQAELEARLEMIPLDAAASDARFEAVLERFEARKTNRELADQKRAESRAKALGEMKQHLEDGDLSQALRSAVEVQSFSDNYEDIFEDGEIQRVITWANEEIPKVEAAEDWLYAQELLYRLRTLYEDTSHFDDYDRLDKQLESINQRVSLLARYAPQRLHLLRNQTLERLGEESLGEFNPDQLDSWTERVKDIDDKMLRTALRRAASDHVEGQGWRALLYGGVDALDLFSTTPALSETFTNLSDPEKVAAWRTILKRERQELEALNDNEITYWTCRDLLEEVARANQQTINIDERAMYREFGDGAMYSLDRFSEIIWPDSLRRFEQATEGNFVGIGVLIRHGEKREIVVVNPLEGTPAYFAGVKPEDVIVTVDGESTVGWSLNDAVDEITGPKGEQVTLGLKREGVDGLIETTIARDVIKLRSVKGWDKLGLNDAGDPTWDWYIDPDMRIAYIRLTQFTEDSYFDLLEAWEEICADGQPNGLIFDMRYNPGGLLTAAVQISNLFMNNGTIVSGEDKNGQEQWRQRAQANLAPFGRVPSVVLINKGSASASEIVAGALQAHGVSIVLGERTFGKGSVQTVHQVADKAKMKLTTQYFRLPATREAQAAGQPGRLIHKRPGADVWGVDPDIEVTMSPSQVIESIELRRMAELIPLDEQVDADAEANADINDLLTKGLDPQLETALLILEARALSKPEGATRHARTND